MSANKKATVQISHVLKERAPTPPGLNPKDQAAKAEGKTRLDLLDLDALTEVARVMEFGAITKGYGVQNYATVEISMRVYIAAILRHLRDLQAGEDIAPDSGLPHWAHIGANAMIVLKAAIEGKLVDDRGPGPVGDHPLNHMGVVGPDISKRLARARSCRKPRPGSIATDDKVAE